MSEYQGQTPFERAVLSRLDRTEARQDRFERAVLSRLDRIERDHGSALEAQRRELNAIRVVLTGDRAQYHELDRRVTEMERKAG